MTEFVRFPTLFEFKDEKSGKRTRFPAGWAGEVSPAVVKAARAAGVLTSAAVVDRNELNAARKAVADAKISVGAAKTDEEKAKAEEALKAAEDALAKLEG